MTTRFSSALFSLTAFAVLASPLVFVSSAHAAGAAVLSLSADTATASQGLPFSVQVFVNPQNEGLDTVRAVVQYPANLLRVERVTGSTAFPRSAPGNTASAGTVSYGFFTVGAPVNASSEIYTIVFAPIAPGTATLEVVSGSHAFSNGNERLNEGALAGSRISVALATPQVVPGQPAAPQDVVVTSPTHPSPSRWSQGSSAEVEWSPQEGETFTGYVGELDRNASTDPSTQLPAGQTSQEFGNLEDGAWYFHVKGIREDGTTSDVTHRSILVDTTPPNPFEITLNPKRAEAGGQSEVFFGTTDDVSGVVRYEVNINKAGFVEQASPLVLSDLETGEYFIEVKAVDGAGNERFAINTLRVYPEGEIPADPRAEDSSQPAQSSMRKVLLTGLGLLILFLIIKARSRRSS